MFYLNELKARFFLILFSFVFTFVLVYLYKETLLFLIIKPNYSNLTSSDSFYFIFTSVIEIFYVYIDLVLFFCFQFLALYFIYHLFSFISPALFLKEFKLLYYMIGFLTLSWIILLNLLNFFLIPMFWNFFLSFQNSYSANLHFEAKLNEYLKFYVSLYYLFLGYAGLLVSLFFLFYYSINNLKLLKNLRKIFYFSFILLSTIVSPPDVISQVLLSFFCIFTYEVFFIIFLFKFYIKQVTS